MTTPTQLHLICKLQTLRNIINTSNDLNIMMAAARQAFVLATPVPIDPLFGYKIEGKERTLTLLTHEIRSYEISNSEQEVVQFQLSSTILMLMLQYMQGSLEDMEMLIKMNRKVA